MKNQGASTADDDTVPAIDDDTGDGNAELDEIFKDVPMEQHLLLNEIRMDIENKVETEMENGYMIGAVLEGLPENPDKATTCSYIVRNLPDPDWAIFPGMKSTKN